MADPAIAGAAIAGVALVLSSAFGASATWRLKRVDVAAKRAEAEAGRERARAEAARVAAEIEVARAKAKADADAAAAARLDARNEALIDNLTAECDRLRRILHDREKGTP